jgi:hypothetical protein
MIELTPFERDLIRVDMIQAIQRMKDAMKERPRFCRAYQDAIDIRETLINRLEREILE